LHAAALSEVIPAVERALSTGARTVERAGAFAPTRDDLATKKNDSCFAPAFAQPCGSSAGLALGPISSS
ncbi:MAG: hypothetical protein VB934_16890, partial [Polyangiaceae bacterium]